MANFLQLNDPNILKQTRNISWGQALQTENPFSKSYQGYNPSYKGADKTSLKGYTKQGLESLKGNFLKGSNVGGATSLTRKLALTAMDYAPKALGVASKFLGPLSFLFGSTPANAGEQEWIDMMNERRSKNYGPWTQGTSMVPQKANINLTRFKQQQLMNQRKQQMQQTIRQAEAAEAAKQKAAADAAAKATSNFDPSGPTQASIRRDRADKSGRGHIGGFTDPGKGSYGPHKADGGLINFYRYGGFSG